MFLGASLNPSYFREKVNLFVALAPVATTANMGRSLVTDHIKLIEFIVVDVLKYYNWFAPMPQAVALVDFVCDTAPFICNFFKKFIVHSDVDNLSRFDVFLSNEPSGQSYRTFVYYFQMVKTGRTALYDYGKVKNLRVYGSTEPPLVPFEDYSLPTALLSGSLDDMADPADVAWTVEALGDNVVFQKQYKMDHFSFALAKDMSFFSEDVVGLLKQYNKLPEV